MADELRIKVIFDTSGANKPLSDLPPKVKAVEGSLKNLEIQWKRLEAISKSGFAIGSPQQIQATKNAEEALKKYKDALTKVTPHLGNLQYGSANTAMTLQALNYTIRDSPYFFRDFSLGLLAIGNNLNPLIDGLIRMRIEAGGGGKALLFLQSHLAGITVGFSVLISVIQAVTFALAKNKEKNKDDSESLKELADRYKTLAEKIRDVQQEAVALNNQDVAAAYRGLQETLEKQIELLDELIRKKRYYDSINTGKPLTGQGYATIGATIFSPSEEDIKKAKENKTLTAEQIKALEAFGKLLNQVVGGDLAMFKKLSSDEQGQILDNIKKWGGTLREGISKEFDYAGTKIELTRESAKRLTEQLEKLIKTAEKQKQYIKTEEQLKAEIKILETLKEQTQNVSDQYQYQLQINKLLTEIRDRNLLAGYKDVGETLVKGLEITPEGGIKEMKPIKEGKSAEDILRETKLIQNAVRETEDQFKFLSNIVSQTGDSIFQSLMHGKDAVESMVVSIMILIAKMLVLRATTTLFTLGAGTPAAVAGAAKIGTENIGAVSGNFFNQNQQANLFKTINEGRFGQSENLLRTLINRVEALNMNMLNNRPIVNIIEKTPALKFTKEIINKNQDRLTRGNIIVGS